MIKKILTVMSILLIMSSFVFAEGLIQHEVYNPFNEKIADESATFSDGKSDEYSETHIETRLMDFNTYSDQAPGAPYCRIGGLYYTDITLHANHGNQYGNVVEYKQDVFHSKDGENYYNNPEAEASEINPDNHGNLQVAFDLFYCMTTQDLLNMIEIPSSWQHATLTVYCNDGGNINHPGSNYDVFTSYINTYKACVVINEDLEKDNVIIYGFDVGNDIIDSDDTYFYSNAEDKRTSPVLPDMEYVDVVRETVHTYEVYGDEFEMSYNDVMQTSTCELQVDDRCQNYDWGLCKCTVEPVTDIEALEWIRGEGGHPEASSIKRIEDVPIPYNAWQSALKHGENTGGGKTGTRSPRDTGDSPGPDHDGDPTNNY